MGSTYLSISTTTFNFNMAPLFGSAGGTGICNSTSQTVTPITSFGTLNIDMILTINEDCSAVLKLEVFANDTFHGTFDRQFIYWDCASFNCKTGGTFTYDHYTFTGPGTVINPPLDYTGTTITLTPDGAATWQQCGQNSDGTTYTGSTGITNPQFLSAAKLGTKQLPTIPHPDRCDSYIGRDEFRSGCNGWLCAGKCQLGIEKCMPGSFCQTCEKYVADPDFIGQGPEGWTK